MTPEQKQAARNLIDDFKDAGNEWDEAAVASHMTALLQELVDAPAEVLTTTNQAQTSSSQVEAPEPEPVAWMVKNGFVCSMIYRSKKDADNYAADQQKRHDLSGSLASFCVIPLYTAPPEPEPVAYATGYYAGCLSIATVDGRVLPAGTALYLAPPAPSVPDGWKLVPVEPTPEPFGYFKAEPFGWTDCAETDDGAIALYSAPSEPKPVARVTGYYAGYLSIATVDGRVLPTGTALYTAPPASSVPDGWKHDCAGIMQNDVELWLDSCPHCGKPRPAAAPTPAEAPADVARDAERLRLFEQWTEMGYEHTKEPRFEVETESDVIEITNDERNGAIVPIAEVSTGFNGQIGIEQEANARRIVACVNACEGIPTGVLEKQGMVPIEQVTHDIEQQRDKLLAALEGLTDDICSLIDESSGVANLHLNGDIAFWSELEAGGQFERLTHLPDALRIIAEVKGQS